MHTLGSTGKESTRRLIYGALGMAINLSKTRSHSCKTGSTKFLAENNEMESPGKTEGLEKPRKQSIGLLQNTLSSWALIYDRPIIDKVMEQWFGIFGHIDPEILREALILTTTESKRMPTPGFLTAAIDRVRERKNFNPSRKRAEHYSQIEEVDAETGKPIVVRLYSDGTKGYRAEDCPEGRAFLESLRGFRRKPKVA
jgi:hypothetical protein